MDVAQIGRLMAGAVRAAGERGHDLGVFGGGPRPGTLAARCVKCGALLVIDPPAANGAALETDCPYRTVEELVFPLVSFLGFPSGSRGGKGPDTILGA
jgi:hypothetical protein